jgi:GT2 family glycosyltransferase
MEVAVAVVSWNTRELLRGCLSALEADAGAGRAEVWVVDNASQDGSAAMVTASFPWVRLIASEENLGFGPAVNAVARATAGAGPPAWIAPANADTAVRPGALAALLQAGTADPRAGIIAPRLILPDTSTQHSVHPFPGLRTSLAFNSGLGRLSPRLGRELTLDGRWDRDSAREVDWAHGAFLLIRRRAFDQVGGFDPEQFLYAEDLDLAWRLTRAGWHTRYEPAARVDHAHAAAIAQLYGDDRDFAAQRSAYAWMLRRRGATRMRACALLNTLGAGARAAAATPAAALRGGEAGRQAWQLRRHTRIHLDGLTASRETLRQHR